MENIEVDIMSLLIINLLWRIEIEQWGRRALICAIEGDADLAGCWARNAAHLGEIYLNIKREEK